MHLPVGGGVDAIIYITLEFADLFKNNFLNILSILGVVRDAIGVMEKQFKKKYKAQLSITAISHINKAHI